MTQPFLQISNISKSFGDFSALRNISFDIHKNEFVCLLGPSGCGKTTLLRIIAGLEQADKGSIQKQGGELLHLPAAQREFGIVFQSYALFPNLTAIQNVEYGLKNKKASKAQRKQRAIEALQMVDLEHIKDKYPAHLSGGQQQRVALARAIALSPSFLLLDEPLSALDAKVRQKLRHEIREIQDKLGITTIMVTHDQEEALTMADKVVVMNNAEVMQVGTPEEIYYRPANPFVADFIGSINMWGHLEGGVTQAIRPEHIQLSRNEGVEAVIQTMEFRGSTYRLQLTITDLSFQLYNQTVEVDLFASFIKELDLQIGSSIYVQLPESQFLSFKEQVGC
jgi:iron(III) transport system ATP-binding protein